MKIRFCGPTLDTSGYGEFSRYFVEALHNAGHEVCVEPILADPKPNMDFGKKGSLCKQLQKASRRPDINIVTMIPMFFKKYSLPNCKNVGFTMWETTRVPDDWVKQCNEMDAILVPCEWNKKTFVDSGVTVPIHIVYPGMSEDDFPEAVNLKDKKTDAFHFYSIFQWIERKNPIGLLRAYFAEFASNENVCLTLKTYRSTNIGNNQQLIMSQIDALKKDLKLKDYPEIRLLTNFLSHDELRALHKENHCFVLPHRAEGFGLPHMKAMSYGNPTIATDFSGNVDFMLKDNSYPIPYHLTPAFGMSNFVPWYDGTMYWAEPDLYTLAKTMRDVYKNYEEALSKGLQGRLFIMRNFNEAASVEMMEDAIKNILK